MFYMSSADEEMGDGRLAYKRLAIFVIGQLFVLLVTGKLPESHRKVTGKLPESYRSSSVTYRSRFGNYPKKL